jgi:hypothetical protein
MEKLASHSGLIHIGVLLNAIKFKPRFETISGIHCVDPKIFHGVILASMIALMSIGEPDFDAIVFRFRWKWKISQFTLASNSLPLSPAKRRDCRRFLRLLSLAVSSFLSRSLKICVSRPSSFANGAIYPMALLSRTAL